MSADSGRVFARDDGDSPATEAATLKRAGVIERDGFVAHRVGVERACLAVFWELYQAS